MTTLVPIREDRFAAFVESATTSYAQDNVTAGRWPPENALERSRADFERLLPQGLQTPDNHIYEIQDEADGQTVGFVWYAVVGSEESRSAFVYNIRIEAAFRGRGHAKAALEQVEQLAIAEGMTSIGLHVFGFNTGAQALYRSLGYGITGFNMRKPLRTGDS